jgi:methionyl-tRNA synthetase
MREIMTLADRANQYIDERKPWSLAKDPRCATQVQTACTDGLNLFRVLLVYLKPVLPALVASAERFLGVGSLSWEDAAKPLLDHQIRTYEPLMKRIDPAAVASMVEASKPATSPPKEATSMEQPERAPNEIDLDEFLKTELRVATVLEAQTVDGADKLLRLTVDLGTERRTILAGIRAAYDPAGLIGRQVIVVANLKPRKMRFGTSEGMLLAAGDGNGVFLLGPDQGAKPGMRVR